MTSRIGGAIRHRRLAGICGRAGFSGVELVVVLALAGVIFGMTVPFFLRYYRAAAVKSASQQIVALLDQARWLAIQRNAPGGVCVRPSSTTQWQFVVDGCSGTAWIGPGTDATGHLDLPTGFTVSPATNVTFDYLGAAPGGGVTYAVTHTSTGSTLTVTVSISGRIRIL